MKLSLKTLILDPISLIAAITGLVGAIGVGISRIIKSGRRKREQRRKENEKE